MSCFAAGESTALARGGYSAVLEGRSAGRGRSAASWRDWRGTLRPNVITRCCLLGAPNSITSLIQCKQILLGSVHTGLASQYEKSVRDITCPLVLDAPQDSGLSNVAVHVYRLVITG